jgi:hypothetical protein
MAIHCSSSVYCLFFLKRNTSLWQITWKIEGLREMFSYQFQLVFIWIFFELERGWEEASWRNFKFFWTLCSNGCHIGHWTLLTVRVRCIQDGVLRFSSRRMINSVLRASDDFSPECPMWPRISSEATNTSAHPTAHRRMRTMTLRAFLTLSRSHQTPTQLRPTEFIGASDALEKA